MTYDKIKESVLAKNHKWFNGVLELNIIFVRTDNIDNNTFKDKAYICYISEIGSKECVEADITTLPGWYYLQNPMNTKGTAILKPGQYIDAYKIGNHFNQIALILCGNIVIYRDNDKDKEIDLDNTYMVNDIGLNVHHADGITKTVGKWSAGCIVFQSTTKHAYFMFLCEQQIKFTKHDKFSITLIMKEDIK